MSRGRRSRTNTKGPRMHAAQKNITSTLDKLAEFEEFQRDVLPKLQTAVKSGKTAEEIASLVGPVLMAKLASAAIRSEQPEMQLAVIKEIFDRAMGKPKQSTEVTNRYEKLSDAELDAMLESELKRAEEIETKIQ